MLPGGWAPAWLSTTEGVAGGGGDGDTHRGKEEAARWQRSRRGWGGGAGAPPEGQPQPAGAFAVPGEPKDDVRPRMQENWVLQP